MKPVDTMRHGRWLREPLFHFCLLGAALFGLLRWTQPEPPNRIVIPANIVREFSAAHERRVGKPPTEDERRAIVQRIVDDEVLYREAIALGLDQGDLIVRRRLIQKMQFLTEDLEPIPEPTDPELEEYLEKHRKRYTLPCRVTMTHLFAASGRHGEDARPLVERWRQDLAAGADPVTLGDPFLRGREFRLQTERDLSGVFGPSFAASVLSLPVGRWSDPLRSSYGWHLVRVSERSEAREPALSDVRAAVRLDWQKERRAEANLAALGKLRERYEIQLEPPEASPPGAASALP